MAQQSFLDKVREWIGGVAWYIFLWSARMTEEEYFAEQARVAEQHNEAVESIREACPAWQHDFLRDKAGHSFCYRCGEQLSPRLLGG